MYTELPRYKQDCDASRLTTVMTGKTTSATRVPLIPANPRRVHLVISMPNSGDLFIYDVPGANESQFITLSAGGAQLELDYWTHGPLVGKAFFHAASAGGNFFGVIETFYL